MKPLVLVFAGSIASGKSTVAQAAATALGWSMTSFGDYVRLVAQQRRLPASRPVLQAVGADLIAAGWEPFCWAVLAQAQWTAGQPLVIEGLRHVEAIPILCRLTAPVPLRLIYITVDTSVQQARLQERGTGDATQLATIERHSTETQVKSRLAGMADLQVDGSHPVEELVAEICLWVEQHSGVV